jgi:hypothetical protein
MASKMNHCTYLSSILEDFLEDAAGDIVDPSICELASFINLPFLCYPNIQSR